eukprot:115830_1
MVTVTNGQWAIYIIAHLLYAVLTYVIAEYFRKRVLTAFYGYVLLFIAVIPFLFVPHAIPTFITIKYFIVNIPYLLMLFNIMAITSGSNCIQTLSKKLLRQELTISKDNGDIHGYKPWISWFWWALFVLNVFVALCEDIVEGSIANAICGVILCLPFNWPIPIQSLSVTQSPNGEYYTFVNNTQTVFELRVHGISFLWVVVYTSWNCCLLLSFYGMAWMPLCAVTHLGVPLAKCIIDKRTDLWLFYRAFALGFLILGYTIVDQIDSFPLDRVVIYDKDVSEQKYHLFFIWGVVNCVGASINFIIQFTAWKRTKEKISIAKKTEIEIHTETNIASTASTSSEEP